MRTFGCVMALVLTTGVAACGSGSPAGPGASSAVIAVTATPSPITGAPCTGCGAGSTDREAATTLAIQETAGVAATVTAIEMTLREQGTNAVIASGSFESAAIGQLAGSNRVAGRGTLTVHCGVHYPVGQGGKAAVLTYVVRVTDDKGNQVAQTLAVTAAT
jgi:hypothetical protein